MFWIPVLMVGFLTFLYLLLAKDDWRVGYHMVPNNPDNPAQGQHAVPSWKEVQLFNSKSIMGLGVLLGTLLTASWYFGGTPDELSDPNRSSFARRTASMWTADFLVGGKRDSGKVFLDDQIKQQLTVILEKRMKRQHPDMKELTFKPETIEYIIRQRDFPMGWGLEYFQVDTVINGEANWKEGTTSETEKGVQLRFVDKFRATSLVDMLGEKNLITETLTATILLGSDGTKGVPGTLVR